MARQNGEGRYTDRFAGADGPSSTQNMADDRVVVDGHETDRSHCVAERPRVDDDVDFLVAGTDVVAERCPHDPEHSRVIVRDGAAHRRET